MGRRRETMEEEAYTFDSKSTDIFSKQTGSSDQVAGGVLRVCLCLQACSSSRARRGGGRRATIISEPIDGRGPKQNPPTNFWQIRNRIFSEMFLFEKA